jgi:hypothetical protein
MVQLDTIPEEIDIYSWSWEEEEVKKDSRVNWCLCLCSCHAIVHIILLCNRDMSSDGNPAANQAATLMQMPCMQ